MGGSEHQGRVRWQDLITARTVAAFSPASHTLLRASLVAKQVPGVGIATARLANGRGISGRTMKIQVLKETPDHP